MKTATRLLICMSALLLLSACASAPPNAPPPTADLFTDTHFGAPAQPVHTDDLFKISEPMRAYLNSPKFAAERRTKGEQRGLIDALYQQGELKLEYDASATRNAADTYAAGMGNCLSLVIMTAAFAKEMKMPVYFQNVVVDEQWSRVGELYFTSTHVNLSLASSTDHEQPWLPNDTLLTVDFLPPEDSARLHTHPLEEATIVAMYMNNRAVELLAQNRIDDAYWWARGAVERHPNFTTAYNTLGVIYQRAHDSAMAEKVLQRARARDPENSVIMRNLVPVLTSLGKQAESDALAKQLAHIDPTPPYHFFNLGMTAINEGNYTHARELFAREVRRAPYNHEFHFWLGIAHWYLGEADKAKNQLASAINTSTTGAATNLYSQKLNYLRALTAKME